MNINVAKTKQLITLTNRKDPKDRLNNEHLSIRGEAVERVKDFVYLGSVVAETGSSLRDINRRISTAAYKFNQLEKLWRQSGISLKTKVQICRTTVLATLLYGAESWTCTQNEYARLNVFNTKRLRTLAGKKRDEIRNADLLKLTRMRPLENYVRYYRLRWAGHVRRMDDSRLPKMALFGKLAGGSRGRGRPKKTWMDSLNEDCEQVGIPASQWIQSAKDRLLWCSSILSLTSVKKK